MCSDAKQWMAKCKLAFTFREIFQKPLSRAELMALATKTSAGIHDLYSAKGALKVGLPEDGRTLTQEQILLVQVRNPDLIRYPLFELDNLLLFGFQTTTREALMAVRGESTR